MANAMKDISIVSQGNCFLKAALRY